jgi:hypothetical protein
MNLFVYELTVQDMGRMKPSWLGKGLNDIQDVSARTTWRLLSMSSSSSSRI